MIFFGKSPTLKVGDELSGRFFNAYDLHNIYLKTKRKTKDKIEEGYWKVSDDIQNDRDKIKTIDGKIRNTVKSELDAIVLTVGEKLQIENQINLIIQS